MGAATVLSDCFVCKELFAFHPEDVISIKMSSETRLPLDLHPEHPGEWTQAEEDAAYQVVICPPCIEHKINPARATRGMQPQYVFPEIPRPWEM
jgi:hypothetical protein